MPYSPPLSRLILAYLFSVCVAAVLGAIVQTQFNLTALTGLGVDIPGLLRARTTVRDVFSAFTPTYAFYIVTPALLVSFTLAYGLVRLLPGSAMLWYPLAGTLALLAGIPLANQLAPGGLLIGATRDVACLVVMALGGAVAGLEFARLTEPPLLEPDPWLAETAL